MQRATRVALSFIRWSKLIKSTAPVGTFHYPAGVSDAIEQQARHDTGQIMQKLDTQGLFAFEFFLTLVAS